MKDEKRSKIVAAITVNAVLLVFILVAVVIAQIVQISVLSRRKEELQQTYLILKEELNEDEELIDRLNTDVKFEKWFMEYVDVYGDDDPLNVIPDGVIIK